MNKPKSFETWTKERQEDWIKRKKEIRRKWELANLDRTNELNRKKYEKLKKNKEKLRAKWRRHYKNQKSKMREKSRKYNKLYRERKMAIKFFQITQAVAEIAKIDTTKLHENTTRKHVGASI